MRSLLFKLGTFLVQKFGGASPATSYRLIANANFGARPSLRAQAIAAWYDKEKIDRARESARLYDTERLQRINRGEYQ